MGVRDYFHGLLAGICATFVISDEDRRERVREIYDSASGTVEYYFFIVLSCIIATIGLIQDSAAVIIGAMVIAPLMSPVLGVSMSIVRGDIPLLLRALRSVVIGVVMALAVSCLTAWIVYVNPQTPQILARTQPNILDLIVGLAAGMAGAYAMNRKSLFLSLSGVAIAVSLMPPLAVTGIGLALKNADMAYKSFLLCFSNMVAINMAAILMFTSFGFIPKKEGSTMREFRKNFLLSLILLVILAIPLGLFLQVTIRQSLMDREIRSTCRHMVDSYYRELMTVKPSPPGPHEGDRRPVGGVVPSVLGKEGELREIKWFTQKIPSGSSFKEYVVVVVAIDSNYRTMDDDFVKKMREMLEMRLNARVIIDIRIYQSSYETIQMDRETEIRDRPSRRAKDE